MLLSPAVGHWLTGLQTLLLRKIDVCLQQLNFFLIIGFGGICRCFSLVICAGSAPRWCILAVNENINFITLFKKN